MPTTVHAFDYLAAPDDFPAAAICVAFGDEPFLQRLVARQLQSSVVGGEEVPFAVFDGKAAEWRDVLDELSTVSLFGGATRLVVVDDADDFVSKNRSELEDYVEKPRKTGVLILKVGTWASNTRLYKAVAKFGLQIECRPPEKTRGKKRVPDEARLRDWLSTWCATRHDAKLSRAAADLLLELTGPQLGMLDQDLAKLALFAGRGGKISDDMVRDIVGGWRAKTTWDLVDAAADGDAAEALRQLDRLLQAGENPLALFGQIAWSLRRFAAATRVIQESERTGRRIKLPDALEQAGFRRYPAGALDRAEKQLRQLGRERAGRLYQWLLEADLALKGTHSTPHRARLVLEKLFLRMAKQLASPSLRRVAATP